MNLLSKCHALQKNGNVFILWVIRTNNGVLEVAIDYIENIFVSCRPIFEMNLIGSHPTKHFNPAPKPAPKPSIGGG